MLRYVVMASNRFKSGLQVTNSDDSSASDQSTVLYLDPVRAAPRGGLVRPQNHQFCVKSSPHEPKRRSLTKPKRYPYPHSPNSEGRTPIRGFSGLFSPTPTPTYTKSEDLGRSWKKKSSPHAKSVTAHRTHRVGYWGAHWFGQRPLFRLLQAHIHV